MDSFRFVYTSIIICPLFITSTDCKEYTRCRLDDDCLPGYFCYLKSGLCSACENCTSYNRNPGDKPCAHHPDQCGPCLEGFEVELFTNNEVRNLCKYSTLPPDSKISNYNIDLYILLSIVLLILLLIMSYIFCKITKHFKASNCTFSSLLPSISGFNHPQRNLDPVSQGFAPSAPKEENPCDDSGETTAIPLLKQIPHGEDSGEYVVYQQAVDETLHQSRPFRGDDGSENHPFRPFSGQDSRIRSRTPEPVLHSLSQPTIHSASRQSEIGPEHRRPSLGSDRRTQENENGPRTASPIVIQNYACAHATCNCRSHHRQPPAPRYNSENDFSRLADIAPANIVTD